MLRRIAALYAIEKELRGQAAEDRTAGCNIQSREITEVLKPWLEQQLLRLPKRSGLADAIRYTLTRWTALCRFLEDGRIDLDTNTVERAIRPVRQTTSVSRCAVTHLLSIDRPTPKSAATCFLVRPLVSAMCTASLRNSSVRVYPIVHLLCCNKCYQRSGIKPL